MDIQPGRYIGHPVQWGMGETKAGLPHAVVDFVFDVNGSPCKMPWYGSFKTDKSKAITIKALLYCGLKGNDLTDFSMGVDKKALDVNQDVELVIEKNVTDKGTFLKIAWVNSLGGSNFKDLAKGNNIAKSLNIKAEIMAARNELGLTNSPSIKKDDDDELPF